MMWVPKMPLLRSLFRPACSVLALALLPLAAVPNFAAAQSADDVLIQLPELDGIVLDEAVQPADILAQVERSRRAADAVAEVDPATLTWISPLRLLDLGYPTRDGITRISGEREWVTFDVYAGDIPTQQTLRVTTVSGINNLPERSHIRVSVNGTDIGQRNLSQVEAFGAVDFLLPPDTLVPGRNRVQIEFRQHHRIYCGPEASFDLWTDLDLSRSGLVVRRDAGRADIGTFMMALAAQATGVRAVEIRGLDALGGGAEQWRSFLVSRLNQVLSGAPVVFRFSDYWTAEPDTLDYARITILPAAQSQLRFVTAGDGAQVMVLEVAQGTKPEDLLVPMGQFDVRNMDRRAALVEPERDVTFAEIGVPTEVFSQHYALRSHVFRLPDAWLVLTAAKARIQLDYAYALNLPEGAVLLMKMNGTSIRLLPLRGEGGAPITAFPIDFEARLMHPGTNVLTFEMFVPGDPANLPCPTSDAPVLQIGDGSTLRVPYSPSMSIPDMDMAFAALGPDSPRKNDMSGRAFSDMDVLTLSAALTRSRPQANHSTLHLIAIDDLGSLPTAHHRADRRLLEDTVLMSPATDALLAASGAADSSDPFQARRQVSGGGAFSAAITSGWEAMRAQGRWLMDRMFPNSGDQLNSWLAGQRGQAILFQLDPTRSGEIWMLRSPDSDIHDIALAMTSARAFGGGPKGQVSVLSSEGYWINWFAPDRRPMMLEPWSRENFRVAMGNFVSARPIFYTILMLGLAMISAIIAMRLVISTREHKT